MVIVALILLVVVVALIVRLAIAFTGRMVERFVNREFKFAESITETGKVPEAWLSAIARRTADPVQARGLLLRRLERMCAYFEKESFFGNPDDKQLFQEQIAEVRRRWETAEWSDLAAAAATRAPNGKENQG